MIFKIHGIKLFITKIDIVINIYPSNSPHEICLETRKDNIYSKTWIACKKWEVGLGRFV